MQYWLMKCEPSAYTIEDLERDGVTSWEGVRNFQARNFLRAMKKNDKVLFYASNADPSGVTGLAKVVRDAYPDVFAMRKGHKYYDPKSTPENPIWWMVEIGFVARFREVVPLETLRSTRGLEQMVILRPGSRLSVTPVTKEEYEIVAKLGKNARSSG